MRHIAVIDYGSGNLHSVLHAVKAASSTLSESCHISLATTASEIAAADAIILPGVGHFADCRANLAQVEDLEQQLADKVLKQATPFLGICVGMQLLATTGHEGTKVAGLDWIAGDVTRLQPADAQLKIPHMGWNDVTIHHAHPVLRHMSASPVMYFVHSYHFEAIETDKVIASTHYGQEVTAIVARDTMIGTQFHPEKSQKEGLACLAGFLEWRP